MKFVAMLAVAAPSLISAQAIADQRCNMVGIAERAVAQIYPRFDLKKFKQKIFENDDEWFFTYVLPHKMAGGAPFVMIDKKACKVTHIQIRDSLRGER